jgi:hypothetical protein
MSFIKWKTVNLPPLLTLKLGIDTPYKIKRAQLYKTKQLVYFFLEVLSNVCHTAVSSLSA